MKALTKIFDGRAMRLDNVAEGNSRRIRTVGVLNNTPYFLYVGREPNVTRESAVFVVEPYTDVIQPLSESQALYVLEGPAIGTVPANCQATVLWDAVQLPHGTRRTSRNVVIPVFSGPLAGGSVSTILTAQGQAGQASTPEPFAVPASAARRTLYRAGGSRVTLEGGADGRHWLTVLTSEMPVISVPAELALPPYLRLKIDGLDGEPVSVFMVVDL